VEVHHFICCRAFATGEAEANRHAVERQLDLGVDGIITDYPTRLRALMEERGMKLPKTYELKG
jgi:glycerophosphoryl diester phosphodiesterase